MRLQALRYGKEPASEKTDSTLFNILCFSYIFEFLSLWLRVPEVYQIAHVILYRTG